MCIRDRIGSAAGGTEDLLNAQMAFNNTQSLRTKGLPGIGGALINMGEMGYDAAKSKGAREELAKQMGIATEKKEEMSRQQKQRRSDAILQATGDKNLAMVAFEDEEAARQIAVKTMEDKRSGLEKEWSFMEQMPDGPDKEKMKNMLLSQKETVMKMPLEFGYGYDENGEIVMLPGEDNPRRVEMMNEHMKMVDNKWQASQAQAQTIDKLDQNLTSMDRALDNIDWTTTGVGGKIMSQIPGTDAYNLYQTLDTLKATVAFRELIEMRNASKTGGALGNVSNREIQLLYSSFAPLSEGMSADELRKSVMQMTHHYEAMKWGMANEKQFLDRVHAGEMSMEDARAALEQGKKQAADTAMLRRATNPDAAAKAYQDRFASGKATEKDYDQFESIFGFRPKAGRSY